MVDSDRERVARGVVGMLDRKTKLSEHVNSIRLAFPSGVTNLSVLPSVLWLSIWTQCSSSFAQQVQP